jgi:hypothetical protein
MGSRWPGTRAGRAMGWPRARDLQPAA